MAKATDSKDKKTPKSKAVSSKQEAKAETAGAKVTESVEATTKKAGPKAARAKAEAKVEASKPAEAADKPKKASVKPARPGIERRGKKYQTAHKQLEKGKIYSLEEAVALVPKLSTTKFDGSVELHINLNVDPKQADQMVRGMVVLPHGSGKTQRVAVLAGAEDAKKAKAAGADVVGETDLLEEVKKGNINFDVLIATPEVMPKLGKYAKELGPKGLMPNPKSGTVATDVAKAVKELKSGRVEYRMDPSGIVHRVVGKCSFKTDQLLENAQALVKAIKQAKPSGIKGTFISKITLTTTMGPSVQVSTSTK